MSILVVQLVPEGILFAADRNITTSVKQKTDEGSLVVEGQSQRPKVLKWPNQEAIIGYVGAGTIGGEPTDLWLYHSFIGQNLSFDSFKVLAESLTKELNSAIKSGEIGGVLVIHIGGFEKVDGVWKPVVWFIRNTTGLTPKGDYILGQQFECSEEISDEKYFGDNSGSQIREKLKENYFSFRQGFDLGAFNALDGALRLAMHSIVNTHPAKPHPFPSSLEEWSKHVKMAVLGYGAYFEAFYEPYKQYVGGGADVVWAKWPA